jgi:hypothetical protein
MMTEMLGYLDLDVGGAPGLVTSAVWDEEEDAGAQNNSIGVGIYRDTTIAITLSPTIASSVSLATASTSAVLSLQSVSSLLSTTAVTSPDNTNTVPRLSTPAVTLASNPVAGGSSSLSVFLTSPESGGSQPTAPGNTISTPDTVPTTASGAEPSATRAAGATPSPVQTGMVGNCVSYHQVVAGDTCSSIATAASIALTDFYTWNPAVGTSCASLLAGFYACIAVGS